MSAHDEWAKGREMNREALPGEYGVCAACGERYLEEPETHRCWGPQHPLVMRLERLETQIKKIPTPETVMVMGTLVPKVANIVDVTLKPAIFHGEDRELLERIEAKLDRLLKREA